MFDQMLTKIMNEYCIWNIARTIDPEVKENPNYSKFFEVLGKVVDEYGDQAGRNCARMYEVVEGSSLEDNILDCKDNGIFVEFGAIEILHNLEINEFLKSFKGQYGFEDILQNCFSVKENDGNVEDIIRTLDSSKIKDDCDYNKHGTRALKFAKLLEWAISNSEYTERVVPIIENYNQTKMEDILEVVEKVKVKDCADRLLDFYENVRDPIRFDYLVEAACDNSKSNSELEMYIAILERYADNKFDKVFERLWSYGLGGVIGELMSDRAYNAIKKSDEMIAVILSGRYNYCIKKIDGEFEYDEIKLVKQTEDLINHIHKYRHPSDLEFIRNEFYNELNRAIGQVSDHKSKVGNLRQYCREVEKHIRDNASELMVVHNG